MPLMLHAGAQNATREQVIGTLTPEPTRTHQPVPHGHVIELAQNNLSLLGWHITNESYGLWGDNSEMMFGVMDVSLDPDSEDTFTMSLGIRNSHNKRFSAGLTAGSRVFVCDNMAFSGDIVVVRRHTTNIWHELDLKMATAILQLNTHRTVLDNRFDAYRQARLTSDATVHDFLIRSVDADVIPITTVAHVLSEWREPSHDEFRERNVFSLFNAYTEALKGTDPLRLTSRTETLHTMADDLAAQLT